MQLFSIGLFELNRDGSRKKDKQGQDIPTYDNRDIKELARVFTGLKAASYDFEWRTSFFDFHSTQIDFDDSVSKTYKMIPFVNMARPMVVDEKYHDRGNKELLNGHIKLPGGENGQRERFGKFRDCWFLTPVLHPLLLIN